MNETRLRRIALFVACALIGFACIQDDGSRWHPLQRLELITVDQEREIGMDFDRGIHDALEIITDPEVMGFLNDLGERMVGGIGPQPFIYRFRIVKARQLNAFAVPGGYIYFHTETFLSAGSLDEFAGVMGHEIAHVRARHYAHRLQKQRLQTMLTQLPMIAAAIAAEEPGLLTTGMALNVALQLRFSREDEAEADQLGAIYTTRAGYDSGASAKFFGRILDTRPAYGQKVPPYLFTHPDVELRIRDVEARARTLKRVDYKGPDLRERFHEMQRRLATIVATGRLEMPGEGTKTAHSANDAAVASAETLIEAGHLEEALVELTAAAIADPKDPRVSFRIGKVLSKQGRLEGSIKAFRRTIELDSSRALVFYELGMAYKARGDRQRAVYYLEQALQRAPESSTLRHRTSWEVAKLSSGVIAEAGFADGSSSTDADTPAGFSMDSYHIQDKAMVWWGRVSPPVISRSDEIVIRWRNPAGEIVRESAGETRGRVYLISKLDFADPHTQPTPGAWTVEIIFEDEIAARSNIHVRR